MDLSLQDITFNVAVVSSPVPYPRTALTLKGLKNFSFFMGTFFAKCIQDSRLVDIPLSRPLLKLMCGGDVVDNVSQNYRELLTRLPSDEFGGLDSGEVTPTEDMDKELILDPPKHKLRPQSSMTASMCTAPWYAGLLNHGDFETCGLSPGSLSAAAERPGHQKTSYSVQCLTRRGREK